MSKKLSRRARRGRKHNGPSFVQIFRYALDSAAYVSLSLPARAALIVLWEASDRVCGKRLRALLPILLPALERNGHLHLHEAMRQKILAMSASTIDRLLRVPRDATRLKKARRAMPAARRRVPVRTFADWTSRRRVVWRWTWSRIAERSTAAATSTAWC